MNQYKHQRPQIDRVENILPYTHEKRITVHSSMHNWRQIKFECTNMETIGHITSSLFAVYLFLLFGHI